MYGYTHMEGSSEHFHEREFSDATTQCCGQAEWLHRFA
ncbi:hypothetical protein Lcho_3511 [Leptothrix cholodnii SP-6]|uniref:Uncharacterized protein n=1 Tax=Leptothrix cholodnii (strain ATCC 51168 / LMG 8142 / SP-6) TaxID=395495 RepID=B1Y3R2_LEPCP|nr:hypothetical protein Lcho_3511 [Leptothrix cholodnii SP-6]